MIKWLESFSSVPSLPNNSVLICVDENIYEQQASVLTVFTLNIRTAIPVQAALIESSSSTRAFTVYHTTNEFVIL